LEPIDTEDEDDDNDHPDDDQQDEIYLEIEQTEEGYTNNAIPTARPSSKIRDLAQPQAKYNTLPSQTDFVMAYSQDKKKERVFMKFPTLCAEHLPEHLQELCSIPLLLKKALYGFTYSGKVLFEEQEELFKQQGQRQTEMPALWVQYFEPDGILMVLHHSDDLQAASDPDTHHLNFIEALKNQFSVENQQQAGWYLQARTHQEEHGNTFLNQQRYSKDIISRYLGPFYSTLTPEEKKKYLNPQTTILKQTKTDNSPDIEQSRMLEQEHHFRFIEAVESLNYSPSSFFRGIFTTRKGCKHICLPGRLHYNTLLHFLNHIRRQTPGAMAHYHSVEQTPFAKLAGNPNVDLSIVWFTDTSLGDCDDQWSTGCHLGLIQGSLVDYSSLTPGHIPGSSAESESKALHAGVMVATYAPQVYCNIVYNNAARPLKEPVFIDSSADEAMNKNDKDANRIRHIERRWLKYRMHRQLGWIQLDHVKGNNYNAADIGIKANAKGKRYKISIIEHSVTEETIAPLTGNGTIEEG
jgi:hypothetical protein